MGSLRFHGVLFIAYPNDHPPLYVHGFAGDVEIVVDLLLSGNVGLANRIDAVRPPNAKRADVKRIFRSAKDHFEELVELWESYHGKA